MSDVDRLLAAFASGELLRPSSHTPNLVDLSRAIAAVCGVPAAASTPGLEEIAARIGDPPHLVFVLADGLGLELLEALPARAFLRRQLAMALLTVFPSTTAVGLTTLASGEWPARHGIIGWWTYLREIDGAATVVKFERRTDERPIGELGVRAAQLLPLPSQLARFRRDTLSLLPARIVQSDYSCYATGGTARRPYGHLEEAVDAVVERIAGAAAPTYTYLYSSQIDAAAHEAGVRSRRVAAALRELDGQIERLAGELDGRARIVLTADHGHQDAPRARRYLIEGDEALAQTLRVAPSYDPRVMCFHLRPGAAPAFREAIAQRFGDTLFVLSTDEVEALELLGPGPLSALTRERVGDYMAIVRGTEAIGYRPATGGREITRLVSQHSGLTPEQMRIPLVIA